MFHSRSIPACLLLVAVLHVSTAEPRAARQQEAGPPAPRPPTSDAPQGQSPQDPAPEQTPVFRGGINFVRVDVIVDDRKNQPVMDLTQADFEVIEDGKPQVVEQFTLVRVDGNPRPGAPPPREIRNRGDEELIANSEDVRVFVFFFDDYHVRRANSMSVRAPLTRFVQNQLRPNDVISVMYPLTPVSDLSFTRNHNLVLSAIDNFTGRKFDYTPVNQFEQNYARYPTETVERIRNDVVMGALRGLSVRLGSLREGRKSIIFVSEGFTAMLPPQMRRQDASALGEDMHGTSVALVRRRLERALQ
jgi:VWFA-related protein